MITKDDLKAYFDELSISDAIALGAYIAQIICSKVSDHHIDQLLTSGDWLKTKDAANKLGLSRRSLLHLIKNGTLKAGKHYKVINPTSARATYLWQCHRIERLLKPISFVQN